MAGPIELHRGYVHRPDGARLWYETGGHGTALVFAHGLGGNALVWYQQFHHFAQRFRVVVWDQRGFGRSTATAGHADPRTSITDQLALLDHLGIDRAHLIGQSLGGWVTLGATLAAPERVHSLVLSSSTGGIPPRHADPFDTGPVRAAPDRRMLGAHPAIGDRLPQTDPARAYLYQALSTFGDRPPDAEYATMLAELTHAPADLERLHTPTLLICGSRDPVMTPRHVHDAAQQLPAARVVKLDLSHSTYFEAPATWNAVVDGFLDDVGPHG